ncbi:MAG: YlmC/YmxH family sporulation protein [Thermaerobacter sp.]|jgi:YlmC/YmxH family sporulation protein|nr:YlmC/YmxH family sporulation protein [Thermaerobacter sp.]MDA8146119.1 YlmC/YmxH family sporulation protein [Thermaerobacter sp.]
MLKTSDLRLKDVVDLRDGRRLGLINDLEVDLESGRVRAVVVPGSARLLGLFGRDNDYVIPWEHIKVFGVDCILVELTS